MTVGRSEIGKLTRTWAGCKYDNIGFAQARAWYGADSPPGTPHRENAFSASETVDSNPLFKWGPNYKNTGSVYACFGKDPKFEPEPVGVQDLLATTALKRVAGRYRVHGFNAAVALGELPETIDMVSESALAIFRSYRAARKGRFSKAFTILRDVNTERGRTFSVDKHASSNWLALRYGWIPLVNDAGEAVEAYEATQKTGKRLATFRGRTKHILKATNPNFGPSSRLEITEQCVLRTSHVPTALESLGFTSPSLVAWELLPFSFVVDWFWRVGDYLELRAVLPKTSSIYVRTSRRLSVVREFSVPEKNASAPSYISQQRTVNRTLSPVADVPPPRIVNPFAIKNKMVRLTDALALGVALTRK